MRVVLQRVSEASVSISKEITASIASGFLVLLGVETEDTKADVDWLVKKLTNLRVFPDAQGAMNQSIQDINGEFLVVSQFTLHASTKKGNRPSFIKAARPEIAKLLYEYFVKRLANESGLIVKTGTFGAMMQIALVNEGPVTINIDSKNRE